MIIYKATNKINGKVYIGQAVSSLERRKSKHIWSINNGCNYYFHCAIRKYGIENFKWETIQICKDMDELNKQEIYFIAYYNSMDRSIGYNLTKGGRGSVGFKHSETSRQGMSENTNHNGKNNPMFGKKHSKETKEKMRQKAKLRVGEDAPFYGRKHSKETKQKMRENHADFSGKNHPNYGKIMPESTKNKLLQSHLGGKLSEKTKEKISRANLGHIVSETTKQKISKANSGKNNGMYGVHLKGNKSSMYGKQNEILR